MRDSITVNGESVPVVDFSETVEQSGQRQVEPEYSCLCFRFSWETRIRLVFKDRVLVIHVPFLSYVYLHDSSRIEDVTPEVGKNLGFEYFRRRISAERLMAVTFTEEGSTEHSGTAIFEQYKGHAIFRYESLTQPKRALQRNNDEKASKAPPEIVITIKNAADYLGKHPRTIHNWIRDGWLPYEKHGGKYRFKKQDLDTCLEM